jgi:proteasome lid subunit RPN8/RPN11
MEKLEAKLIMSEVFWHSLILSLKERGDGKRESGAFILSDDIEAKEFLLYDDLDPRCLETGAIHFKGSGYVKLWDYCLKAKLRVIADVHTHPYKWTDQSDIDQSNPMISQRGHIAMIVPFYAARKFQGLLGVGAFEYLGDHNWQRVNVESGTIKITKR